MPQLALEQPDSGAGLGGWGWSMRCCDARAAVGNSALGAVVVDASSEDAVTFYGHIGFHQLDERRRISDIEWALGG